jgi:hypothetical protein
MGNFDPHGAVAGHFDQTITVTTTPARPRLTLSARGRAVSAMTISRLSVPMPAFLPSVNQIGFDSYDWIASTIARTRTSVLLWVIGATRDRRGRDHVDPRSAFAFPLFGRYAGGALSLSSPNVPLQFSFGAVPLRRFLLRGTLTPSLRFAPGASLYADTVCATVPHYGPELLFTGICNPSGILAASGTFESAAYRGPAVMRPAGVRVGPVAWAAPTATRAGSITARLAGRGLPTAARHVAAILLTDAATGGPLAVQPRSATTVMVNRAGRIVGVRLHLPRGTVAPARMRAYVIVDAFPLASVMLGAP